MLKIALCDDDEKSLNITAEKVHACFAKLSEKIELFRYTSGKCLLDHVDRGDVPHIILLDIDMPEISGMEVAREIREKGLEVVIIFLTAHERYVFDAIEYNPFRYVRKGKIDSELEKALIAARKRITVDSADIYVIKSDDCEKILMYADIAFVETEGRRIAFETKAGERILSKTGLVLKEIAGEFEKYRFVQVHSGCMVNVKYISSYTKYEVCLKDGRMLPVSRRRMPFLQEAIARYWKEKS